MDGKKRFVATREQMAWGLTALVVVCLSVCFYLMLTKMPSLKAGLGKLINVLMPVILGCVMAYLLLPVYNAMFRRFTVFLQKTRIPAETARHLSVGLSTVLSLLLLVTVISGLLIIAGPQVVQSIIEIIRQMPSNIDNFSVWLTKLLKDYPEILSVANQLIKDFETSTIGIITDYVMPSINMLVSGITSGLISVLNFLFDAVVGLIVCAYLLVSKGHFAGQAKRIIYSMFDTELANNIVMDIRSIHRIFSGFVSGKLLDSMIIGMISFVVLSIMNMPYAVMISVVVGVTNIIPFFGPFIGAVPSAVIIFTVEPVKALYFIIYIVIIQQIDGNIIGPKILGNSTGLSSFWVLFSILVGAGLFGFAGMLLGVPVFAVFCMFLNKAVLAALERRSLPQDEALYENLKCIDAATHIPEFLTAEDSGQGKEDKDTERIPENENPEEIQKE